MTTVTLPPSRREWAKACQDRANVETAATARKWSAPDDDGQEWKNIVLQIEDGGSRVLAVPHGAAAVVFVFKRLPH